MASFLPGLNPHEVHQAKMQEVPGSPVAGNQKTVAQSVQPASWIVEAPQSCIVLSTFDVKALRKHWLSHLSFLKDYHDSAPLCACLTKSIESMELSYLSTAKQSSWNKYFQDFQGLLALAKNCLTSAHHIPKNFLNCNCYHIWNRCRIHMFLGLLEALFCYRLHFKYKDTTNNAFR